MQRQLEKIWYHRHPLRWFLWPFSLIYQIIVKLRCYYLVHFCQRQVAVPVIVVGNVTVGGVGKTPLVIALVKAGLAKGLRVGVVSRGYGARITTFPYDVQPTDNALHVGDEPLLIAQKTACPVVIAPKRLDAIDYLLANHQSQLIISDDGLQHYAMGRAVEIVVIDGARGLGNNMCLPAGPLRETSARLQHVDLLVVNGGNSNLWPTAHLMNLTPGSLMQLSTGALIAPKMLPTPLAAVAGIGHPERFFTTLATMGLVFTPYHFADHHVFTANDLAFVENYVVMTEKDAVKCRSFATPNWYVLPVEATLSDSFWQALWSHEQLKGL